MCESNENYVPLNDGYNWKGDPNATSTGQGVPQLPPGAEQPAPQAIPPGSAPPIAVAQYNPTTGDYVGPDGKVYTQGNLAHNGPGPQTWQSMMVPPSN
jgi:phospholipid/cholesterol/gamma-HCH transport system substrate-binding protein